MDTAELSRTRNQVAAEALLDVAVGFSIDRLRRIKDNITWSETIGGLEVQFEVMILEWVDGWPHCAVSAEYFHGPSGHYGDIIDGEFPRFER